MSFSRIRLVAALTCSMAAGLAQASLVGRNPLTTGGSDYQAYYDTTLGITWLADANLAASNAFGVGGITSSGATAGSMPWTVAQNWIAAVDAASYLGVSTWRLPTMVDIDNDGCVNALSFVGTDCGYNVVVTGPNRSEMANMYYVTLANIPFFSTTGTAGTLGIQNTAPFSNLKNGLYWTNLTDITDSTRAWYFGMPSGGQRPNGKTELYYAWAVAEGDVFSAVPLPAGAWLLGSGLAALGLVRRRLVA